MGLFTKKCKICKCKLTQDKRKYDTICHICGMEMDRIIKQFNDSIRLVNTTKNPVTGYNRCLLILSLAEQYYPYVESGICWYPNHMTLEEIKKEYISIAAKLKDIICEKNSNKKIKQIIGIPTLNHYKNLQNPNINLDSEKFCKACGLKKRFYDSKYCLSCLAQGSSISPDDLQKYCTQKNMPYSEDDETVFNAIIWKLTNYAKENIVISLQKTVKCNTIMEDTGDFPN